jgi:hypothetical protein
LLIEYWQASEKTLVVTLTRGHACYRDVLTSDVLVQKPIATVAVCRSLSAAAAGCQVTNAEDFFTAHIAVVILLISMVSSSSTAAARNVLFKCNNFRLLTVVLPLANNTPMIRTSFERSICTTIAYILFSRPWIDLGLTLDDTQQTRAMLTLERTSFQLT